jgi:putative effector of murein hydrolase
MVLLFAALSLGLLRKQYVEDTAKFLLQHITLFFIPFGVIGIMQNAEQILSFWPVFLLICLISTWVTFLQLLIQLLVSSVGKKGGELMQTMINSPLFGLTLTLVAYVFATWLYQKTKFILFAPLITAVTLILVVLQLLAVPLETYRNGADIISLLLIPATASLAFSIYQQIKVLKAHLFPILLGTLVGSAVSVACIMALAHLFQLPQDLMVSLLPKSTTTAIAVELSEAHGGILGVTMAAVLVTGVFGAMFAPYGFASFAFIIEWQQGSRLAHRVMGLAPRKPWKLVNSKEPCRPCFGHYRIFHRRCLFTRIDVKRRSTPCNVP